jgi:DNA-binding NarL/FixJ family response regulator
VRGQVASQRARSATAGPKSKSGCSSNRSDSGTWRNRNGAANGAINGEPAPQRNLSRISETHTGELNGTRNGTKITKINGALAIPGPIVVIDQRMLARDCLVKCLGEAIVGRDILAFASASEWLAVADTHPKPGVILICAARYKRADQRDDDFRILKCAGDVPCIVVADTEDRDQAVSAIEDGAHGFLPTGVSLDIAVQAVRLVETGGTFIPAKMLISSQKGRESIVTGDSASLFTVRQSAVLAALHQGRSNKQIACQLQMSEGSVKVHVREIMRKVNARNRTEVVLRTHQQHDD